MVLYRIDWIDEQSRSEGRPIEIECPDDHTAVKLARDLSDGRSIEVWHRERLVAFVGASDNAM